MRVYNSTNGDSGIYHKVTTGTLDSTKVQVVKTNKQRHQELLDEIHHTYVAKNTDYGNSFEEQFKEYGLLSSLIRLDDKMRRLKQLHSNEAQVKDESVVDTLLDLANYSIMTVMELRKEK